LLAVTLLTACGSSSDSSSTGQKPEEPSEILFSAYNLSLGSSLWKSDGTQEGTTLVRDISPYISDNSIAYSEFISFQGKTFFLLQDDGSELGGLWVTDGTSPGTRQLKGFRYGDFYGLTPSGGQLLFSASDWLQGVELWKSDGTPEGTAMVTDLTRGVYEPGSSSPYGLTPLGDMVLFAADDYVHGTELWRSDGTPEGTVLVKDIWAGAEHGGPGKFGEFDNKVWFTVFSPEGAFNLWSTDGSESGTQQFTNLAVSYTAATPIAVVNNLLLFSKLWNPTSGGEELWSTDGTVTGTVSLLPDISESARFTSGLFCVAGDLIYFFTRMGDTWDSGTRIWRSDGTPEGTYFLADFKPGQTWAVLSSSDIVAFNNELYFYIYGTDGKQVWKTDGTNAGTKLVTDISLPKYQEIPFGTQPGGFPSLRFLKFIPSPDTLYFGFGWYDLALLFKTDGTEEGSVLVKNIFSD
jgi:ELWxxDGT repeat protein